MKNKILQQLIDFIDEAPTLNRSILKEKIYELDKKSQPKKYDNIPFEQIIGIFNTVCSELSTVEKLTDRRKSAIHARIQEHGMEKLGLVFSMTAESDYLCGKVRPWKANFDWILNPTNFVKILEGNYKNVSVETKPNNPNQSNSVIGRANMETVVKNAQFTPINLGKNE